MTDYNNAIESINFVVVFNTDVIDVLNSFEITKTFRF